MPKPRYDVFPSFDNVAAQIFNFLKLKHPVGQHIRDIDDLLEVQHKLFPEQIPAMSLNYIHHLIWEMQKQGFPINYDNVLHRWYIKESPHRFSVEVDGVVTHTKLTLEQAEHYLHRAISLGVEDASITESLN